MYLSNLKKEKTTFLGVVVPKYSNLELRDLLTVACEQGKITPSEFWSGLKETALFAGGGEEEEENEKMYKDLTNITKRICDHD